MTYEQRCQIYALKKRKISQAEIAKDLGVNQSTISRELARNAGKRGYHIKQANDLAKERSVKQRSKKRVMTTELVPRIEKTLVETQWSQQQIAGRFADEDGIKVSHERIYQHIWADKKRGGELYKNFRQQGKKRNARKGKNAGRGLIPARVDIAERPPVVDEKSRVGDWDTTASSAQTTKARLPAW